jgi:hypothetical protein
MTEQPVDPGTAVAAWQPPTRKQRRRPAHRPTLVMDHAVVTTILGAIEDGVTMRSAAALAGVHERTVYGWDAKGLEELDRRDEHWSPPCTTCGAETNTPAHRGHTRQPQQEEAEVYVQFSQALARARASVEKVAVAAIRETIQGGALVKDIVRTLRDGSEEHEQQWTSPDGKLALEFLTRTRPRDYARQPVNARVSGPDGGPLEISGPGGGPIPTEDVNLKGLAARVAEALAKQREELPAGRSDVVDAEVVEDEPRAVARRADE